MIVEFRVVLALALGVGALLGSEVQSEYVALSKVVPDPLTTPSVPEAAMSPVAQT